MARDLIQFRRGLDGGLPVFAQGEPGVSTDKKKMYVGGVSGNIPIPSKNEVAWTPYDFGAIGDGVVDDTQAFLDWVAYLQAERVQGHIPMGRFLITQGLVINTPITITSEKLAILNFILPNVTDVAIKIQYDFNLGKYYLPIITGKDILTGTGLQIVNANAMDIDIHYMDFFKNGVHLMSQDRACENNNIRGNIIENVETCLIVQNPTGSPHWCDVNEFYFNTLANCKYCVKLLENGTGKVAHNTIRAIQMWTEFDDGVVIYSEGIPSFNNIFARYFRSDSIAGTMKFTSPTNQITMVGTDGLLIGGNATQQGVGGGSIQEDDFAEHGHSVFEIGIENPVNVPKIKLRGFDNIVKNINQVQNTSAGFSGKDISNSQFNNEAGYGLAQIENYVVCTMTIPPRTAPFSEYYRTVYHQLAGHNFSKIIDVIPLNSYAEKFSLHAEDFSGTYNREIRVFVEQLKDTTQDETLKFALLVR